MAVTYIVYSLIRTVVQTFEIKRPDGTSLNMGRQHRQFPELLAAAGPDLLAVEKLPS